MNTHPTPASPIRAAAQQHARIADQISNRSRNSKKWDDLERTLDDYVYEATCHHGVDLADVEAKLSMLSRRILRDHFDENGRVAAYHRLTLMLVLNIEDDVRRLTGSWRALS